MNYDLPPGQWSVGGEYVVRTCPNPHCDSHVKNKKNKFYWNVDSAKGWCFSCNMAVRGWNQFNKLFNTLAPVQFMETSHELSLLDLPSCWYENAWDSRIPKEYLIGRGVTEDQCRACRVFWLEEESSLALLGDALSWDLPASPVGRVIGKSEGVWMGRPGKALTNYGFGIDHLTEAWETRVVVMFEGIFDVLAGDWLGRGVSMFGSNMSELWLCWLFQNKMRPILWLDPDAGGDKGLVRMVEALDQWEIPHRVCPLRIHPKHLRRWDEGPWAESRRWIAKLTEELQAC